ncbi:uncharacterized protein LOC107270243 [Cephus cinctus]|uniref:Uncharacterized protein LOC107270243 n=1 Tax=Cephus cinctus TaxID=211228 RepID=A0AAJ7RM03_CEPCN|nr:uncharacterized protein LOC107270243 [Cephus cinctus]
MKSVDNIKTFENVLHNSKDEASQFAALISNIGGNSPKNNIQRILLLIFDNSCATQCSWKRLRNNFGVSKLIAIKIMKGATPDGLISDDGIVEIKCPFSIRDKTSDEGIAANVPAVAGIFNKDGSLNKRRKFYYQIQG